MLRYLRIAVSALSLTACVLLIALWVRSYSYQDCFLGWVSKSRNVDGTSWHGWIAVRSSWFDLELWDPGHLPNWGSTSHAIEQPAGNLAPSPDWTWHFYRRRSFSDIGLTVPCWFPIVLAAAVAAVPWIRQLSWRFSLRTLLIATTLLAVVLGAIVYAVRS